MIRARIATFVPAVDLPRPCLLSRRADTPTGRGILTGNTASPGLSPTTKPPMGIDLSTGPAPTLPFEQLIDLLLVFLRL